MSVCPSISISSPKPEPEEFDIPRASKRRLSSPLPIQDIKQEPCSWIPTTTNGKVALDGHQHTQSELDCLSSQLAAKSPHYRVTQPSTAQTSTSQPSTSAGRPPKLLQPQPQSSTSLPKRQRRSWTVAKNRRSVVNTTKLHRKIVKPGQQQPPQREQPQVQPQRNQKLQLQRQPHQQQLNAHRKQQLHREQIQPQLYQHPKKQQQQQPEFTPSTFVQSLISGYPVMPPGPRSKVWTAVAGSRVANAPMIKLGNRNYQCFPHGQQQKQHEIQQRQPWSPLPIKHAYARSKTTYLGSFPMPNKPLAADVPFEVSANVPRSDIKVEPKEEPVIKEECDDEESTKQAYGKNEGDPMALLDAHVNAAASSPGGGKLNKSTHTGGMSKSSSQDASSLNVGDQLIYTWQNFVNGPGASTSSPHHVFDLECEIKQMIQSRDGKSNNEVNVQELEVDDACLATDDFPGNSKASVKSRVDRDEPLATSSGLLCPLSPISSHVVKKNSAILNFGKSANNAKILKGAFCDMYRELYTHAKELQMRRCFCRELKQSERLTFNLPFTTLKEAKEWVDRLSELTNTDWLHSGTIYNKREKDGVVNTAYMKYGCRYGKKLACSRHIPECPVRMNIIVYTDGWQETRVSITGHHSHSAHDILKFRRPSPKTVSRINTYIVDGCTPIEAMDRNVKFLEENMPDVDKRDCSRYLSIRSIRAMFDVAQKTRKRPTLYHYRRGDWIRMITPRDPKSTADRQIGTLVTNGVDVVITEEDVAVCDEFIPADSDCLLEYMIGC